jgi:HisJ family histidinol phosphate phosphatase
MELPIKIKTNWDVDLHVHNKWSLDIPHGPRAEEYMEFAEKHQIHIGFLDHYEVLYQKKNLECPFEDKKWVPIDTFAGDNWNKYLEELDDLKNNYSFVSTGLEIDYAPEDEGELSDFIKEYGSTFDFFVGTLHELERFRPVTLESDLRALIKKHGSFEAIVEIYFDLQEKMIKSGLFTAIAHIDTIYRYCGSIILGEKKYQNSEYGGYTQRIIELCIKNNIWIEYNLSGFRYSVNRPFPPEEMVKKFSKLGAKWFVGSDCHTIPTFNRFVPKIKKANALLRSLQN